MLSLPRSLGLFCPFSPGSVLLYPASLSIVTGGLRAMTGGTKGGESPLVTGADVRHSPAESREDQSYQEPGGEKRAGPIPGLESEALRIVAAHEAACEVELVQFQEMSFECVIYGTIDT
ncbi:uncharacterized protein C1orf53 homolog isoform X2 [Spea bombifrons]|uniref:uncharacterized protein C1orf53 homolog isoform X2 n=1 Tax=Spea bombifrons TaxID=233779 RepID=UPI00234994F0|nr:uncharacterized protein C1orf53 homolog isoform X2 [Spea bombifrons]